MTGCDSPPVKNLAIYRIKQLLITNEEKISMPVCLIENLIKVVLFSACQTLSYLTSVWFYNFN